MDFNITNGLEFSQQIVVTEKDTAKSHGSGKLDVFATPAMIALMENSAVKCIESQLKEGFETVGTQINAKHIKATKIGGKITCSAKLIEVDGKKLRFEIEATDDKGIIGTANHNRYIIEPEKFLNRL